MLQILKNNLKSYRSEEIELSRSCNNLTKFADSSSIYKKGTIHVKGALIYNYHLHKHKLEFKYTVIKDSDKIKFLMLKLLIIKDDVVSFSTKILYEFDLHKYVDYDLQFQKTFTDI